MNVLDLFSGIGGFSLGLERTGMRTVAFCESNAYCRAVLRKHWPDVPIYDDVRALRGRDVAADVICGGFPCQDISIAGAGAGIDGERSGLWREFARLIGELRPRYAIVENTAALLGRGLGRVLGDLTEMGYDAEWGVIPAAFAGAEHHRARTWLVAYPEGVGCSRRGRIWPTAQSDELAGLGSGELWKRREESRPVGVADGVPDRVHRIRALGNAVYPGIPEYLGRRIIEAEAKLQSAAAHLQSRETV